MPRWSMLAALVVALVATGSCNLDVSNPNAPDKTRAFRDPGGLQQMIGGAFRTWVEARDGFRQFATSSLGGAFPPARVAGDVASGLLTFALPGASQRRILWFRPWSCPAVA